MGQRGGCARQRSGSCLSGKESPQMRFSAEAQAIVSALLWGAGVLLVGLINLAAPSYGGNFLQALSSVYPGFHASEPRLPAGACSHCESFFATRELPDAPTCSAASIVTG